MFHDDEVLRQEHVAYSLLRSLTYVLDDLSAEGLQVWVTDEGTWCWRWGEQCAEYPLWALGEALLDAVATRFPALFEGCLPSGAARRFYDAAPATILNAPGCRLRHHRVLSVDVVNHLGPS